MDLVQRMYITNQTPLLETFRVIFHFLDNQAVSWHRSNNLAFVFDAEFVVFLHVNTIHILRFNKRNFTFSGENNVFQILQVFIILTGKRPLGRPRRRWEDNIRIDLVEISAGNWVSQAFIIRTSLAVVNIGCRLISDAFTGQNLYMTNMEITGHVLKERKPTK